MSNNKEDIEQKSTDREPIFLERGDGLGWTLNFNKPVSYLILFVFLAVFVLTVLYINGIIRF